MLKLKIRNKLSILWLLTPVVALIAIGFAFVFTPDKGAPEYAVGINEQVNFQGRLLNSAGAVVPDGTYNMRFKIYQDGDGVLGGGDETLEWTETRESGNKVLVKNGYFSVYLGSVDAFGSSVDWNQSVLWLSVDVGGTGSPSYDGEMTPFNRIGSTPYALNAKQIGGLTTSQLVQLAPGTVQADASTSNSIYINKTGGSGNILQLQKNGSDVFNITNAGIVEIGGDTNLYRSAANILKTDDAFNLASTSATALLVQNTSAADTMFSVDTATRSGSGGNLVKVGNSTGTDGDLTILQLDASTADPTSNLAALNGGLFYDSTADKVKIIEDGVVKTLCNTTDAGCGAGGSTSLQSAYNNSSSPAEILLADGKNLVVTAADAATDPSIIFNLQCTTSCSTNGKFAVQSGGTDVFTISPNGGSTLFKNTSNSTTAFQIQPSGSTTPIFNVDTTNGRIGIGTNAPTAKLDLVHSSSSTTAATDFASLISYTDNGAVTSGTDETAALKLYMYRSGASGTAITNTIGLQVSAQGDTGGTSNVYGVSTLAYGGDYNYGFYGGAVNIVNTVSTQSVGVFGAINSLFGLGGTVTNAYGLQGHVGIDGGGFNYTNAAGLNIMSATNSAGGTITNNYGIKVETQTVGGSDYGIRVDTADTQTLWIAGNVNSTTAAGGIAFGADRDTNLYRSATNTLKTDSNFQIGDATNQSDLQVYGEITRKGVVEKTGLTDITDIFVYDVTSDSDGGVWADSKTSQALSWYSETKDDGVGDVCNISSDDRCGDSKFPRKAIIASTQTAVYIFDAVDFKMFMKFTQSGTYALGADTNNNPSSVFAMNGVVYVGANGSAATGMYAIDFTQDRMYNYDTSGRAQGDKSIASRNTTVTYSTDNRAAMAIRHNAVNAVHGAVLYGSSSIETNGGPLNGVTFIAAATDDSMSVVNLSSFTTLDYGDNLTDQFSSVYVTRRGRLYGMNVTLAQVERYGTQATGAVGIDVAKADQTTPSDIWDEQAANLPNLSKTTPTFAVDAPDALKVLERGSLADDAADRIYVGHSLGMTEIHDVNAPAATSIGWSQFYDTNGMSMHMTGTPRGAFMFDDLSGDLTDRTIRNSILEPEVAPTYGVSGVRGTGLRFDGTSQFLCSDANNDGTCDTDADFNVAATSFNVKVWFKHSTTITGTDVLVDKRYAALAGTEGIGYTVEMISTGQLVFGIQDTAATAAYDDSVTSTQSYNDGQWHHLAAVNTDTGLCLYIDGKLTVACDTTLAATGTLDASQIFTVGADASGAAGGNFWDGDIDDLYVAGGGATTSDTLTQAQVRKQYLVGRSALARPTTRVTDATAVSSTTIGDSGETYTQNAFVGSFVEITGGTGAGQTRRVVSNDGTTLTVSPAWTVTPDTTSDYEVAPEQLYGSTNIVSSIGMSDANAFLGTSRNLYIATNDGSDGGGVSVFGGYGNDYVSELYHADAGLTDSFGAAWSGADADDIKALDADNGNLVIGAQAFLWREKNDRNVIQELDSIMGNLGSVRAELIVDGLLGATSETGNMGGADLAERYTSFEELLPGTVVSMEENMVGAARKSTGAYDKKMLGIVATAPGLIIGPQDENSYPIALTGRVPVQVVVKDGESIKAGDRLTSSDVPGFAMKAVVAGRVLGTALEDSQESLLIDCPEGTPAGYKCTTITVFVNLVDYSGQSAEIALEDFENGALELPDSMLDPIRTLVDFQGNEALSAKLEKSDKIIRYLLARKSSQTDGPQSEILTDRVSSGEVNTVDAFAQNIVAGTITADKIRANQIEGLEIFTDKISSLAASKAATGAPVPTESQATTNVAQPTSLTLQTVKVTLDMTVDGTLFANGALKVAGPVEFNDTSVFKKLVTFIEKSVFNNDVEFNGRVAFNSKDAAGFAVIHSTQQEVEVKFDKPYTQPPVVTLTIKNGVFVQYAYKDLTADGFKIVIENPASQDVEFAWSVVQIKDAKTVQLPLPVTP